MEDDPVAEGKNGKRRDINGKRYGKYGADLRRRRRTAHEKRNEAQTVFELYGKPIIIYTLEVFEKHPEIDGIVVVCVEGWQTYLEELIEKYGIRKVRAIVLGGKTGQESIRHGVYKIHELCSEDSFVLVHDGVRPLIEAEDITRNIQCAREHGNAVTVAPVVETVGTRVNRKTRQARF